MSADDADDAAAKVWQPYTIGHMLETMNASMAGTGVTAELKRHDAQGRMFETSAEEIAELDDSMALAAVADGLKGVPRADRHGWAVAEKDKANGLYRAGDFAEAVKVYLRCLVGLDFGDTPEERQLARDELQLPVLNNLTACYLEMKDWRRAKLIGDKAVEVAPESLTALRRRGRAQLELGDEHLKGARADLRAALALCADDAQRRPVQRLLRRLREAEAAHREYLQRARAMSAKMVNTAGGLYEEDEEVAARRARQRARLSKVGGGSAGGGSAGSAEGGSAGAGSAGSAGASAVSAVSTEQSGLVLWIAALWAWLVGLVLGRRKQS